MLCGQYSASRPDSRQVKIISALIWLTRVDTNCSLRSDESRGYCACAPEVIGIVRTSVRISLSPQGRVYTATKHLSGVIYSG